MRAEVLDPCAQSGQLNHKSMWLLILPRTVDRRRTFSAADYRFTTPAFSIAGGCQYSTPFFYCAMFWLKQWYKYKGIRGCCARRRTCEAHLMMHHRKRAHPVEGNLNWRWSCSLMEEKAWPGVCSWRGTSLVVDFIETRAAIAPPSISRIVPPSTSSSRASITYSSAFIMFKVESRPDTSFLHASTNASSTWACEK